MLDPVTLDADAALALLLAEPLLIRSPSIEADGRGTAQFEATALERRPGIKFDAAMPNTCSRR